MLRDASVIELMTRAVLLQGKVYVTSCVVVRGRVCIPYAVRYLSNIPNLEFTVLATKRTEENSLTGFHIKSKILP